MSSEPVRLLFDVETNGLLPTLNKIHCLVVADVDTLKIDRYRNNEDENTIREGVERLLEADELIGHNIIGFDLKAIKKVYPWFDFEGKIHDTLVSSRALPYDLKGGDFDRHRNGLMPAKLIGSHSLDAWGQRLGKYKGDYAKVMAEKGIDPWAEWNQDMEDYCANDVEVNFMLWETLIEEQNRLPEKAMDTEQKIQSLVSYMEDQGYPFRIAEAQELAQELRNVLQAKVELVSAGIPDVVVPAKRYVVAPLWDDPDGVNAKKPHDRPRAEFGEDYSRDWWADVTVPKKTTKSSDPRKRGDRTEVAPYCKIVWRKFSPTSRDHIRELLRDKYGWKPETWTDKGNPTVDAKVLRGLADTVPHAHDLADIFTVQKLLGYVETGQESWIRKYNEKTGCIHPYTNTGGTVTGRCSHHGPNIAQVPSVQFAGDGHPIKGLEGGYGWECRSLFHVPERRGDREWRQVGVDLSGIEFRMLAEETAKYDDGELIDVVLSGDIHAYNMQKTGINDRAIIKRGLYGLLYGAGDFKLGATIAPDASPTEWKALGKGFRSKLMQGLPALKNVIEDIQREADRGYILAIDGRKIYVRSEHSALNTKLQSSAAIIAKRWVVTAEEMLLDSGLSHSWDSEFVFLAFVHDELQCATQKRYSKFVAKTII